MFAMKTSFEITRYKLLSRKSVEADFSPNYATRSERNTDFNKDANFISTCRNKSQHEAPPSAYPICMYR
jgi:hypothetical protein